MRMPRVLRVGARQYTVTRSEAAVEGFIREHVTPDTPALPGCKLNGIPRPYRVDGLHLGRRRQMYVRARLELDEARHVLLHEMLHAVWDTSGLGLHAQEERVVSALAEPLLRVLQSNPALVRYLTERDAL